MNNLKTTLLYNIIFFGHYRSSALLSNMSKLLHDVDIPTKKATFGMGCFWGPDVFLAVKKGVIRTRVGYSGGTTPNPTYKAISDYTEAIDIDYDPNSITYEDLLKEFWENHDPTYRAKKQYASVIFYHDDEQKQLAEQSLKNQKKTGITTQIIPFKEFYDAEDYHQKYHLQQHKELVKSLGLSGSLLKTSHLAARLNGYIQGFGAASQFESEIKSFGLDEKSENYVRKYFKENEGRGHIC